MSPRIALKESRIAIFGGVFLAALAIRVVCSFFIGVGTFGPDGTGAEASVTLGGHPDPLFPILISFFGGVRGLSAFGGAVTALACAKMGQRLGGNPLVCGFMGACAPLLLIPSCMAGGDAPAIAFAASGVALAWWQKPFFAGLVTGLSLGVKAIALPLWLLLPAGLFWSQRKAHFSIRLVLGLLPGVLLFHDALHPLLHPRPESGILGSWWLASDGHLPALSSLPHMGWSGFLELSTLPTWTGHPFLGALAMWGCFKARKKAIVAIFLLSMGAMFFTVLPMGDAIRLRYLGPASVGITVLAGVALKDRKWVPFLFLWPSLAFASQLGNLRAQEEGINPRPSIPFFGAIDAEPSFEDGGICGGKELRDLAVELAERLPEGAEVAAIRLRDGREQELFWKLRLLRPDLQTTSIQAACCKDNPMSACANQIRSHLYQRGGALVLPLRPESCTTHLASPSDLELASGFGLNASPEGRFRLLTWPGQPNTQTGTNACSAVSIAIP